MKFIGLIVLMLSLNVFSKITPLTEEEMRNTGGPALPPWIAQNEIITSAIQGEDDLVALLDFAKAMKDSVAAGIPQELSIAVDNQRFMDEISDPA